MKILIVTPFYVPAYSYGGIVSVAREHAVGLVERGHEVTVATTDVRDADSRTRPLIETLDGVRVLRFRNLSNRLAKRANGYLPFGFPWWIARHAGEYDRVVIHDTYTILALATALVCRMRAVAYFIMPHGSLSAVRIDSKWSGIKKVFLRAFRTIFERARATFALTGRERGEILAVSRNIRVELLPNGIDLAKIPPIDRAAVRRELGYGEAEKVVLFLGRLHAIKGIDVAIESFATLSADRSDARLLVVGPDDGERADLEWLAERLGIAGKVRWYGPVSGDAKYALYAAADCFLFPSRSEGLPMSVVEALACDLPCALSDACNVPQVAEEGAGIVVDGRDPDDYARAVRTILSEPERYRARARPTVEKYFALPRVLDRLESLLSDAHAPR